MERQTGMKREDFSVPLPLDLKGFAEAKTTHGPMTKSESELEAKTAEQIGATPRGQSLTEASDRRGPGIDMVWRVPAAGATVVLSLAAAAFGRQGAAPVHGAHLALEILRREFP
jgi:hypothetical protein